jgi:enterochelin esterase-like enzyme
MNCLPGRLLIAALIATGALFSETAGAQVKVVRVRSQILGEERMIHVSLPPNYSVARQGYPVVYLLDGHVRQFFGVTVAAAGYDLAGNDAGYVMPPQIVVGVDQRDRGADLGRNQELFTKFLVEELVPFIDREYRTTRHRTLIGHSLGGRFALMTFCRAPGVFPAVIAISGAGGDSTSAGTQDQCLSSAFASDQTALRQLVLAGGGNEPRTLAGVERLRALLRAKAPANWRWTVIDEPGLGHSETPLATIPPGIRYVNDPSVWEVPRSAIDSITGTSPAELERNLQTFYSVLSRRVGFEVKPSLKWMITIARVHLAASPIPVAEEAAQRLVDAYPEDLEGYAYLSQLAQRRGDNGAARRALNDARRVLDKLEMHDVYERERKQKILTDMLAAIPR